MIELYLYIFGVAYKVELGNNINITLKKKLKDLKDLTKSFIPKTLPIQLPNTETNRNIFSNYQEVNLIDDNINHLTDISTELYVDGLSLIKGKLQIIGLKKDKSTIGVVVYDRTISVFEILKKENLAALDFSDLDFTISDANVINSWNFGLNAGKTIYPLADNGQGFGYQDQDNPGTVKDINALTGNTFIDPNLLVPAISVNEILTRMLDDATDRAGLAGWNSSGITSWLDDLFFFHNLKPDEAQVSPTDLAAVADGGFNNTLYSPTFASNIYTTYTSGYAGLISNVVLAIHTGNYKVDFNLSLNVSSTVNLDFDVYKNGVYLSTEYNFTISDSASFSQTFALVSGDKLTFYLHSNIGQQNITNFTLNLNVTAQGTAGLPIASGGIYFNNIFKKINKADFLRQLVKMFNLVVYVDEDDILQLTPYKDIIAATDTLDLSAYILEKNFSILSPYKALSKELAFGYKEGKDYANQLYERTTQTRYGSGTFESNIPFLTSKFDAEIKYSPYMAVQLQNAKRGAVNITGLYGIKNIGSPQDPNTEAYGEMYFMYWIGRRTITTAYMIGITSTLYTPITSNFSAIVNTVTATKDLNFFFTSPAAEQGIVFSTFDPVNSATLFNTFYKTHIEELYHPEAKIIQVEGIMDTDKFNEIQPQTKIIINGALFRLLDLSYNLRSKKSKLMLLKLI